MTGALATDVYELNMAASYLRRGMVGLATFRLFVRELPPSGVPGGHRPGGLPGVP
jgi:nicotinate phosphoribosyltransferase